MNTFTPGPWIACNDGKCPCGGVHGRDTPVAKIISGKWGDEYPALRRTKDSSELLQQYEPYIELIEYGEVAPEVAEANARLIAAAPDLLAALERTLHWLSWYQGGGTMRVNGPYEWARAAIAKAIKK